MMMPEKVIESFNYDYKDGGLYWRIRKTNSIKIGDHAGSLNPYGYRQIMVDRKLYREHHLVWLYHCGYMPKQLDHINGDPSDNRIENLREANQSQNLMNSRKRKNCSSKYKGVYWHKLAKKWVSRIYRNGKYTYLGLFASEEKAAKVYNEASKKYFGRFAKLNKIDLGEDIKK